jgi:DNA-binding response OmpR family regulator
VRVAGDGLKGLELAVDTKPDLIVLDIMLPGANGYEICREIRAEGLQMPILMLTAKAEESDVVLGLELGADDYVTKPFSVRELLARCKALLRRKPQPDARAIVFGPFRCDLVSRKLLRDGTEIELTPKEFNLLAFLAGRPGRAVTRNEILKSVWGYDIFVTDRSVDRCVNTLRAKIEADPHQPVYLRTVREVGYRFEMPDTADSAE